MQHPRSSSGTIEGVAVVAKAHVLLLNLAISLAVSWPALSWSTPTCEQLLKARQLANSFDEITQMHLQQVEQNAAASDDLVTLFESKAREFLDLTDTSYIHQYSSGSHWAARIYPDGPSTLNFYASALQRAYKTKLVIHPKELMTENASAYIDYWQGWDESKDLRDYYPVFAIGSELLARVARNEPITRHLKVLHELRHLKFLLDRLNRQNSPFQGRVQAIEGVLKDDKNPHCADYLKSLSFEEVKTFHAQLKQDLIHLRKAVRAGASPSEVETLFQKVRSTAGFLFVVSYRTGLAIPLAQEALKVQKPVFNLDEFKVPRAVISQVTASTGILKFRIPLLLSQGPEDSSNDSYLTHQLASSLKAASLATEQVRSVAKILFDIFMSAEAREDRTQLLQAIDQAQRILSPAELVKR